MSDEKKNPVEQQKDADKSVKNKEKLSKDELNAISGGYYDECQTEQEINRCHTRAECMDGTGY